MHTKSLPGITLLAGMALGALLVWVLNDAAPATTAQAAPAQQAERRILYYRNPMDPKITSPTPARDSMGMDYIPVYAEEAAQEGGVRIDPRLVQNLGVRTAVVGKQTFSRRIRSVGTVAVDEHGISVFSPKVSGWLERLHVKAVGDTVERGQALAEIYSPELLSAREEYRIAAAASRELRHVGDPAMHDETRALAEAARERLRLLDMSNADIDALTRNKTAPRTVTLRAPFSGIVTEIDAREGASISPEMRLFTLADLGRVWVNVEVYANQLPWVKVGDRVDLTLDFLPGRRWQGKIDYLYPTLNAQSRTVTARLVFDNPDGVLRPGMYATTEIAADSRDAVLAVPREALLRNGTQDSVIVALDDSRFQPVAVRIGSENDAMVEIVSGLHEGQKIVVSGQFLLDAEANFQGASARMQGGDK